MDELFVKVVEMKKIQGNVLLGNMKCQTREFFSFFPMVCGVWCVCVCVCLCVCVCVWV